MAGGKKTLANLVVNLLFDAGGAGQGIQDFGKQVAKVGQDLTSAGKSMTESFTVPIVAGMAAAAAASATWNDALGKLAADAGVSREEVDGLGRSIKDIANVTGQGPTDLVAAFGDIGSAVGDTNEQMRLLDVSARASAAGFGEVSGLIKTASTVMSGFAKDGLDSVKTMDLLVATSQAAEVPIEDLTKMFGNQAAEATILNLKVTDVAGALATMSQATGNAKGASSDLNAILKEFIEPGAKMKESLAAMGLSLEDVKKSIQEKGLLATMQMLQGNLAATGKGFGDFFSSSSAAAGALAMVGGTGAKANEIFGSIAANAGATDQAFKASGGTIREWSILTSSAFDFLSEIGKSLDPIVGAGLRMLNQAVQEATQWWMGLGAEWQEFALLCTGLVAAIGPVVTVVGLMVTALGGMIGAVGLGVTQVSALITWLGGGPAVVAAFGAALSALAGPAVIGAVGVALVALAVTFQEELGDMAVAAVDGASDIAAGLATFASEVVTGIAGAVAGGVRSMIDGLLSIGPQVISALTSMFSGAAGAISTALNSITSTVSSWASSILEKVKSVARGIGEMLGFGGKAGAAASGGGELPGAGLASGFQMPTRPSFSGASDIASRFQGTRNSFSSAGMGGGGVQVGALKGSSKPTSQTISINLSGRELAKEVVKNMPDSIGVGVGFRGSM